MKLSSNHFVAGMCLGVVALALTYLAYRGVIDTREAIQTIVMHQDEIRIERIKKQREELSKETLKWAHPSDINNAIQIREGNK